MGQESREFPSSFFKIISLIYGFMVVVDLSSTGIAWVAEDSPPFGNRKHNLT